MSDDGHVVLSEYRASYRDPVSDPDILLRVRGFRGGICDTWYSWHREKRGRREERKKRVRG
jgi:hypothetical protein